MFANRRESPQWIFARWARSLLVAPFLLPSLAAGCGEADESPSSSSGTGGAAGATAVDASDVADGEASTGGSGGALPGDASADSESPIDSGQEASTADAEPDGPSNLPPVPLLSYEIELNQWVVVHDGDTVVRPLDLDINWNVCASYDPDGTVAEIWLKTTSLKQLFGPGVACQEYTESDHAPQSLSGYLLVRDDQGKETKLTFKYQTQ